MPEFLELAAEQAVGSNYGPAGGRFASKDIRVSLPHLPSSSSPSLPLTRSLVMMSHFSLYSIKVVVVVVVVVTVTTSLVATPVGLVMTVVVSVQDLKKVAMVVSLRLLSMAVKRKKNGERNGTQ